MSAVAAINRPTKGAQRYEAWLKSGQDLTFGEWLKAGEPEADDTCGDCQGTGIGNPRVERSSCWSCNGRGYSKPAMEFDA